MLKRDDNIRAQKRFGEEVNKGNFSIFKEAIDPDVIDHDPSPQQEKGPEGFKHFFEDMRIAFPDMQITVDHMIADEENVAFAYTFTGTNKGNFLGYEPTNRKVSMRGMQISKLKDGKLVERWGASNELDILQQLGHISLPQ